MTRMALTTGLWAALALAALLALPACAPTEEPATYPISGEVCGPDDPVKTLDAQNCVVTDSGVL